MVIVVVIIGVIGAIAIPRLSRGSEGASESALQQNLTTLNKAVELYAAEHLGKYPDSFKVADQLTKFTDLDGNVSATQTGPYIYGPYLRSIPLAPAEEDPGPVKPITSSDEDGAGWVYQTDANEITYESSWSEG